MDLKNVMRQQNKYTIKNSNILRYLWIVIHEFS